MLVKLDHLPNFRGEHASTNRSLRCWCCWRWSFIDTQQEWFLHSTLKFLWWLFPVSRNGIRHWEVFFLVDMTSKKYRKNSDQPAKNHDRIIWKGTDFKMVGCSIVYRPIAGYDSYPPIPQAVYTIHSLLPGLGLYLNHNPFRQQETTQLLQSREWGPWVSIQTTSCSLVRGSVVLHLIPQNQNQRIINCNLA